MRQLHTIALACLIGFAGPAAAEMTMPMGKAHARKTAAERANADAMAAMMKAMAVKPTGDADKDFARMMIGHHEGAIAMAKVELAYGKDPDLRTLAGTIVAAQEKEIAQMKAWLAAHP